MDRPRSNGRADGGAVLAAGHQLIGHTRRVDGQQELRTAGAHLTQSIAETASAVDILCVCVFSDQQLREILLAPENALARMRSGSVVAIHTTGSPRLARELAANAPTGVAVIDATFSGTAEQAARGALTIMVGGDTEAIDYARPVLDCYADRVLHVGPVGAGQSLKLVNNMLFAAQVNLAQEALQICAQQGLDRHTAIGALKHCSGGSWALNIFDGEIAPADIAAGVKRYLDKDVDVARMAARDAAVDLGALARATANYGAT